MNIYIHTWRGTVNIYVYVRMYISYGRKICRIFHDFALKQAFCVWALILTISQINFCELDQIGKKREIQPHKNLPLYGTYTGDH